MSSVMEFLLNRFVSAVDEIRDLYNYSRDSEDRPFHDSELRLCPMFRRAWQQILPRLDRSPGPLLEYYYTPLSWNPKVDWLVFPGHLYSRMQGMGPVGGALLQPGTLEFECVASTFHRSLPYHQAVVLRIVAVWNPRLLSYYKWRKQKMEDGYGGEAVREKWLFHGAHMSDVDDICLNGFRRSTKNNCRDPSICFTRSSRSASYRTDCTCGRSAFPLIVTPPPPDSLPPPVSGSSEDLSSNSSDSPDSRDSPDSAYSSASCNTRQGCSSASYDSGQGGPGPSSDSPSSCRHYMVFSRVLVGSSSGGGWLHNDEVSVLDGGRAYPEYIIEYGPKVHPSPLQAWLKELPGRMGLCSTDPVFTLWAIVLIIAISLYLYDFFNPITFPVDR